MSVLLFMTSDDPFLFSPLGCLPFFSLWPLMTPFSFVHWLVCLFLFMTSDDPFLFVHWVVCPSLYDLWWPLSLLSNGLSALPLFMASDDPFLFCPLGCLSFFSLWPLMTHFTFVHWVVCPSLYDLWCPLSLLSIGLSVLLFMTSDDPFLFSPLGCLPFFSLWPLMTPFSFVHWLVCPSSLYDLWWPLSLLSIGLSVLLLFMTSYDPFLFVSLGCLSFSLWSLMTPFSFVHWVVCPSLYGLWWPFLCCPLDCLSLFSLWPLMSTSSLSIGLSVLLFMASDDSFLFGPLGCLSSLWPLMTPFSFVHWVVCPSLYGLWWPLSLLSIGLSVILFMASDNPSLFCPLGCLSFSLWPLMTPLSFVHWVVCSSLYGLWWHLFLLFIGLSVRLFMTSDDPFLFGPLGCLSFSLWPLMTPFSFVHWVFCPSLYVLWWPLSLLSIGLFILLFMTFDDPFLFFPLGFLPFFSLWPLMNPLSFVHWVVCPSLYGLWWHLSLLSIGLFVLLLFMASDDSFLFCLFGLSVLLLFMASDEPFLFCSLCFLSFFSLWPLMNHFSFAHWDICPSSFYGLWWPLSLCPLGCLSFSLWPLKTPFSLSIGLSVLLLCVVSDDPSLFCPLGFLSFSLWPLMSPFSFVHWVVCPSSLYDLSWPLSLLSIESSVLLFMASDDPFLFCPLGCLSFSLWPLMTTFSFVHWVFCPLYGLWWPLSLCPLGCMSFSLWPLKTPFSFVHWVVCPSLYGSD